MNSKQLRTLTNCSDVSLSVFAYRTFGLLLDGGDDPLGGISRKDVGSERTDGARALSSGVRT